MLAATTNGMASNKVAELLDEKETEDSKAAEEEAVAEEVGSVGVFWQDKTAVKILPNIF